MCVAALGDFFSNDLVATGLLARFSFNEERLTEPWLQQSVFHRCQSVASFILQ